MDLLLLGNAPRIAVCQGYLLRHWRGSLPTRRPSFR